MAKPLFVDRNQEKLNEYARMSGIAGVRSDYVQGGGGNTSVKLDDRLMAIKASGYRLEQIAPDQAYAVLDYAMLRDFYHGNDPAAFADVEKIGSDMAKAATQVIGGLPSLRPSVEAGFHSLLDTYVLHTHPVYANLATCSNEGAEIARRALEGLDADYVFVPYINPGVQLAFAIDAACRRATADNHKPPSIIFMQNHGLIVTGPDADTCLRLHDQVNQRIAAAFGVGAQDWPQIMLAAGQDQAGWVSATPWLRQRLLTQPWELKTFTTRAIYPDQTVFLNGQMVEQSTGDLADHLASGGLPTAKCTVFRASGEVYYQCSETEARTIEETLCAVLFITDTIRRTGRTVSVMDEAGKDFINSWESEKFRKSIAAQEQ